MAKLNRTARILGIDGVCRRMASLLPGRFSDIALCFISLRLVNSPNLRRSSGSNISVTLSIADASHLHWVYALRVSCRQIQEKLLAVGPKLL
jgi:hypothetical protein